jgi:hypothetical protein
LVSAIDPNQECLLTARPVRRCRFVDAACPAMFSMDETNDLGVDTASGVAPRHEIR